MQVWNTPSLSKPKKAPQGSGLHVSAASALTHDTHEYAHTRTHTLARRHEHPTLPALATHQHVSAHVMVYKKFQTVPMMTHLHQISHQCRLHILLGAAARRLGRHVTGCCVCIVQQHCCAADGRLPQALGVAGAGPPGAMRGGGRGWGVGVGGRCGEGAGGRRGVKGELGEGVARGEGGEGGGWWE